MLAHEGRWRWKWRYGHEVEHLASDCEGKGDDEEHEKRHLCDEQQEDLCAACVSAAVLV